MVKEPYSWDRFKKFYRRNDIGFSCLGLVIFMHIVWWQVQQNPRVVHQEDRTRHIGPFKIPYIDELLYSRNKKLEKEKIAAEEGKK